jgi:hypothetical protein
MEDSVFPDEKQHWAKPRVQSLDQSIFNNWNRDKLLQVRDLVQRALDLAETSGDAPDAAAAIRAALDDIERELARC